MNKAAYIDCFQHIIQEIRAMQGNQEQQHVQLITAAKRNKLPKSDFGLPDKSHAANAKARATQMVAKGKLSPSAKSRIDAKANKILGKK